MFVANQLVKSKRTGYNYRVLGYDNPTLDGEKVLLVYPVAEPMNIIPIKEDSVVAV